MAENLYDPRYSGAPSVYLGTPFVRYILIDPVARAHTEGKLPRGELREGIIELLCTDDITTVEVEDDNRLTSWRCTTCFCAAIQRRSQRRSGITLSTPIRRRVTPAVPW